MKGRAKSGSAPTTKEEQWRISDWTAGRPTKKRWAGMYTPAYRLIHPLGGTSKQIKAKSILRRKINVIAKSKFLIVTLSLASIGFHLWRFALSSLNPSLFIYLFAFEIWVMHSYRPCIFNGYAGLIQMSASCSLRACHRGRKWIPHSWRKQKRTFQKPWGI